MLATVTEAKGRLEEAAGRGILGSRASGRQGNLFVGARFQRGKKIEQISACSIMDLSLFFNFKGKYLHEPAFRAQSSSSFIELTGSDVSLFGRILVPIPVFCPLRPSSARSMEPSLSCGWRCWSREVRVCLSIELLISSIPPNIGVRSRDAAFLSVGGTMLRAPGTRFCPWEGGGSGGGGRSVPQRKHHTMTPGLPHSPQIFHHLQM